ncbi:unnamed protein product [Pleuronectes platessa]|uniref:Uncharacterized protein n=1 Tax=Pleuronectes platessa TaxID=8262 RepID=A0A9N7UUH2_PLEPL|nr:unnamed protein product [Pleuronectes platessa]
MCSSPWPGDCKIILHSCRDNTLEDFRDGRSERIRVGKNPAFGPAQRYQITADTSPTTPRALEQITSHLAALAAGSLSLSPWAPPSGSQENEAGSVSEVLWKRFNKPHMVDS